MYTLATRAHLCQSKLVDEEYLVIGVAHNNVPTVLDCVDHTHPAYILQ